MLSKDIRKVQGLLREPLGVTVGPARQAVTGDETHRERAGQPGCGTPASIAESQCWYCSAPDHPGEPLKGLRLKTEQLVAQQHQQIFHTFEELNCHPTTGGKRCVLLDNLGKARFKGLCNTADPAKRLRLVSERGQRCNQQLVSA